MPEIRRTRLGRLLVATPLGDRVVRVGAAAYRALVGNVLAARGLGQRMGAAEARTGIRYRPAGGRLPRRLSYPDYDLPIEAVFPDGEVVPLRLTAERGYEDIDGAAHLHLYERFGAAITQAAPPGAVLDCACGSGYGSAYLARSLDRPVTGVDLDAGVVHYASRRYAERDRRLTFRHGDATTLPFLPSASMAAVVSIETIEHVPAPERVLTEFARVLEADGVLFVTSPDATDRPGTITSPYHVTEYTEDGFRRLLAGRFDDVAIETYRNYLVATCSRPRRAAPEPAAPSGPPPS